jgi:hypothetical protein
VPDLSGGQPSETSNASRVIPLGATALRELAGFSSAVLTVAGASGTNSALHVAFPADAKGALTASCEGHPMSLKLRLWLGGGGTPAHVAAGAVEVR